MRNKREALVTEVKTDTNSKALETYKKKNKSENVGINKLKYPIQKVTVQIHD